MPHPDALFTSLNRLAGSPEGERKLVRELAARVAALSRAPRMEAVRRRWRDVLALRKPDRPPVWCNPVGCWPELLPEASLVCRDRTCRNLETAFKKLLVKETIGDDTPMQDYVTVPLRFRVEPENTWGVDVLRERVDGPGTAWRYKPALVNDADFDRLTVPRYTPDPAATREAVLLHEEILAGTLAVRTGPAADVSATLCTAAADLRGMEPLMMDMIESPALVHRLMGVLRDGVLAKMDALAAAGPLLPNNDGPMFLSDPLRPGHAGPLDFRDCWIHGNSQEFDPVGPDMFEEFLLAYQNPIFARFGAVSYGCCENLTRKLDLVLAIPNLKLLTCSAWTDLATLVAKNAGRHCIMWRHKASDVVFPDDTAALRRTIREQAAILKGSSYQAVLRELQTLAGHPDRLSEWTRITIDAVGS